MNSIFYEVFEIATILFMPYILYRCLEFKRENTFFQKDSLDLLYYVNNLTYTTFPVSVLIPIYNKGHYLQRSFSSLQNQTFSKFEIIAVDDCSSDSSSEIVLKKMETDYRIKFIQHKYNQGIGISRNHLVLTASGQFIMSLDPDDAYVSDSIEIALNSIIEHDADVLEFRIAGIHRNYTDYNWMNCRRSYYENEAVLTQLQKFRYGNPDIHTCKKIIRRSVYVKAVHLILPYIKNKRICISEDLLHVGTVLVFARNYICTQLLVYLYYRDLPDSSITKGYVSRYQKLVTCEYVKQILRYFYRHRKNPMNCDIKEFFNEPNNLNLYNNISDVDRVTKKDLSFIINCRFKIKDFKDDGFLLIYH